MATRPLEVTFNTAELAAHEVVSFELSERLGAPPRARMELRFREYVDPGVLLGHAAALGFGQDGVEHELRGVVTSACALGTTALGADGIWKVRVELASQLALLEHSVTSRIFQDMTVQEIVTKVLSDHGIDEGKQEWRLSASYEPREYCVQYQESALAFVSRLLEKEGIFFSTRPGDGQDEKIVFEDDSKGCDPIPGEARLPYIASGALREAADAIYGIRDVHRVVTGTVTLRDYDFKRPKLDLTRSAAADVDTDLELYDFPGGYVEPAVGERYAQVRLEADQARRRTLEAQANCSRLRPGTQFTLTDAPRDWEGDYVVTEVTHLFSSRGDESRGGGDDALRMTVSLLPKDVPFRTFPATPRPIIDGPQTAIVVGPSGSQPEDIHTDEHGRAKVKFHWDLDPELHDQASCWIRVSQAQTTGSMILPRLDWEVIVEFQQGDPDRPLITGRLYNGRFMPPYALPEGKTRTSFQSASTPGGAGRNEIRFEDKAGSEEVKIAAQKSQSLATGNNKTKSIGNNETQTVGINRTLDIGVNQTIKVTGGFKHTVNASQNVSVGGNREVGVKAALGLSCAAAAISVGGGQFEMNGDPFKGLIALAVEKAAEAAQEAAADAMKKLDAAVRGKIDQVLGPVKDVVAKAEQVSNAIEAAQNGDIAGALGAAGEAAGLPTPGEVANQMAEEAGLGPAADALGDLMSNGEGGGEEGAGEEGGGEEGGGEGGEGEGGGPLTFDRLTGDDFSFSNETGMDGVVNGLIGDAANSLHDAFGTNAGDGGGGASGANTGGPAGAVSGNSAADGVMGPGHHILKADSTFTETIGTLRATIAAGNINTNVNSGRTQDVGAARLELVGGSRSESVGGDKTEEAIGLVILSSDAETDEVGGARNVSVGGAVVDLVGGDQKIAGGAKTGIVGSLIKVEAKTKITFSCGESEVVIEGGGVTIKTPTLNIASPAIKLTKSVVEGPGGGTGSGGAADAGDASGGGGGDGAGAEGGAGGGGAGGGEGGSASQQEGDESGRADNDQSRRPKTREEAQAEAANDPFKAASNPNDGDPEMDRARRDTRQQGARAALDNMTTTDENGRQRPLTRQEKNEVYDNIDFDQPMGGEPQDGWLHFQDRQGRTCRAGDPSRTTGPKPADRWD